MTEEEKIWITAWRNAGPELERIRNEELRALSPDAGARQATYLGIPDVRPALPTSGLIEFQAYMMAWRNRLATDADAT